MQLFKINGTNTNPINVAATTLPQFALSLADQKFTHLWQAHAAKQQSSIKSEVVNAKGDTTLLVQTQFNQAQKQLLVTPNYRQTKVKPGIV